MKAFQTRWFLRMIDSVQTEHQVIKKNNNSLTW